MGVEIEYLDRCCGRVQREIGFSGEAAFFVNTSRLPAGIYYCKIESQDPAYETRKLVIIQ